MSRFGNFFDGKILGWPFFISFVVFWPQRLWNALERCIKINWGAGLLSWSCFCCRTFSSNLSLSPPRLERVTLMFLNSIRLSDLKWKLSPWFVSCLLRQPEWRWSWRWCCSCRKWWTRRLTATAVQLHLSSWFYKINPPRSVSLKALPVICFMPYVSLWPSLSEEPCKCAFQSQSQRLGSTPTLKHGHCTHNQISVLEH